MLLLLLLVAAWSMHGIIMTSNILEELLFSSEPQLPVSAYI